MSLAIFDKKNKQAVTLNPEDGSVQPLTPGGLRINSETAKQVADPTIDRMKAKMDDFTETLQKAGFKQGPKNVTMSCNFNYQGKLYEAGKSYTIPANQYIQMKKMRVFK